MFSHSPLSSFFGSIELATRYERLSLGGDMMKQRCHVDHSAYTRTLAVEQDTDSGIDRAKPPGKPPTLSSAAFEGTPRPPGEHSKIST